MILLLILILLSSCSYEPYALITVDFPSPNPFEEETGMMMWYELRYFDGSSVRSMHIPEGKRSVSIYVREGGLRVFLLNALGEYPAYGGFYEPGLPRKAAMESSSASFASMLISASSYRPEAVSRLSIAYLTHTEQVLSAIDETSFLSSLFEGSLGSIAVNSEISFTLDSIPSGRWIAFDPDACSFLVARDGDEASFSLYPGAYRYACFDRRLLLEIAVDNDRVHSRIKPLYLWY